MINAVKFSLKKKVKLKGTWFLSCNKFFGFKAIKFLSGLENCEKVKVFWDILSAGDNHKKCYCLKGMLYLLTYRVSHTSIPYLEENKIIL